VTRHDYQLVAPWYRWPGGKGGRGTAPSVQKYDDSKCVDAFLADPQRSLRFVDEDHVYGLTAVETKIGTGPLKDHRKFLARAKPYRTDTRKLFLATHKRFYLVVFDLRCDAPGFPRAAREGVCEAGLVVRRRSLTKYPAASRTEAEKVLAEITRLQAALLQLERPEAKGRRAKRVLRSRNGHQPLDPQALRLAIEEARKRLKQWADAHGAETVSEGWLSSATDGIGAWQPVEAMPQTLVEHVTPMFPLIPDPRERRHSGRYGTLYFGLLPTASTDHDAGGRARFDDETLYEVRCFVRRHREECRRTAEPNDCGGELSWSRPTRGYQLAPPFDVEGTAHRPVTIKLPDLPMLAAQTLSKPPGSMSPVKMESPPESTLKFTMLLGAPIPAGTGQLTCFWAIPLITIVALFLLNLFMPIVMLLFGLFWMLALKFCLGGLPGFQLDANIVANLSALDEGSAEVDPVALRATLLQGVDTHFGTPESGRKKPSQILEEQMVGSEAIARFQQQLLNPPTKGADPLAAIEWETPVAPGPELVEAVA
jgi:hypothetical protein